MSSTALEIISAAYRAHHETVPASFSTSQEFPLNIALDVLQEVIAEMNRLGNLYFTETKTALTYAPSTYQYTISSLPVDPRRIRQIRKEATNYWGALVQMDWIKFQDFCRMSAIQTTQPYYWSKYGDTLELDAKPDQDYSIYVYHFKDMAAPTATGDTFLVPVNDEDVLKHNCEMYLGYKIGKWGKDYALQMIAAKTAPMLVSMKADAGIPRQMPRAF